MDIDTIRNRFPILNQHNHNNKPLAYLDNAATTQKPIEVIQAIQQYYEQYNANIHRGIYSMAVRSTETYEKVRGQVKQFLNAKDSAEIIFVRGATEGINLVAQCFAEPRLKEGDEILISAMEHHSNLIPWQMVCKRKKAKLAVIPMNKKGELELKDLDQLLTNRTKMVALVHASNTLGTINPIKRIIIQAKLKNIPVLIDGAQSVASLPVDVQELDCDFFAFSGHKLYGPTGIGVLYGKKEHLKNMSPYQYGGEMIHTVSFEKTTFADLPHKFEAGTPNIAGVVGLGAAIEFIQNIGKKQIKAHFENLLGLATQKLKEIKGLKIIGEAAHKTGIISFILEGIHPHDLATILNEEGVAVRAGHHCTEPIMDFFEIPGTTRASFGVYNTVQEVNQLVQGVKVCQHIFKRV